MTSFTHSEFPSVHCGVSHVETAIASVRHLSVRFRSTKGIVTLLLAGMFSALVAGESVPAWPFSHMPAHASTRGSMG